MKLLLQQQPVARDLRTISSALKMISDMERIGDQAADIAEITRDIADNSIKDLVPIGDMARATIKMVTDSVDSFVRKDLGCLLYTSISSVSRSGKSRNLFFSHRSLQKITVWNKCLILLLLVPVSPRPAPGA